MRGICTAALVCALAACAAEPGVGRVDVIAWESGDARFVVGEAYFVAATSFTEPADERECVREELGACTVTRCAEAPFFHFERPRARAPRLDAGTLSVVVDGTSTRFIEDPSGYWRPTRA